MSDLVSDSTDCVHRLLSPDGEFRVSEVVLDKTDDAVRARCDPELHSIATALLLALCATPLEHGKFHKLGIELRNHESGRKLYLDLNHEGMVRIHVGAVRKRSGDPPLLQFTFQDLALRQSHSVVQWCGDITSTIEEYYNASVQVPTWFRIQPTRDGNPKRAWLFQALPDGNIPPPPNDLFQIESIKAVLGLKHLRSHAVYWGCDCSEDRILSSLATLPQSDLMQIASEQKSIETTCEFCGTRHQISNHALSGLLQPQGQIEG